ncbi:MAG: methyltransferase [Syntrophothermus sp.]|uniref:uroporphyrinogen decarboxylase family protein n=1 Tax=Syntrophothermus sp. TaxID=2736299 RepID=UPI00257BC5FE|nr:uroporphyrinogen decarboxylase family protein [Syntrophothermus sp.]NSW83162.1 methyltransferase [Syntrophothermus sp.]
MTSRERVYKAINHEQPDKVPVDLGATAVTGISASSYAKLRKRLGLKAGRVKVWEPYQILGEVEEEIRSLIGVDVIGLTLPTTAFGFRNEGWKPWTLFDGTEVLVPEKFITTQDEEGNLYIYPEGDTSVPPSGKMPKGGFYFDAIVRQELIDYSNLDPEVWARQMYKILTDEELGYIEETSTALFNNTDYFIIGNLISASFGDIAWVPGPMLKHPRGIRDPQEWYIALMAHPEYVKGIFDIQLEVALENLKLVHQAVGDRIGALIISGTDFGTQNGPFFSPDMYRELFKPYHKAINDWIHRHTSWKTFYHSCGSVVKLLDDFVDAGVDILNPVQTSAAGMDPEWLKKNYGHKLTFWGGGVDTQNTLPFGTPDEVAEQVKYRMRVFGNGGGFVFATVHNIQSGVKEENLVALIESIKAFR